MEKIKTLKMKGVTRRFGNTTALHDFHLEMSGGQFVTLLGPSGCGKSTALNCLAGLLDLSDGEILLNDRPIQDVAAEKRGFGMVFQNYALFPHLSVERNVGYGLELRRVPKAEREKRVRGALELVHLAEFGKRYPGQLSGGQQQRLAIARTVVLEPALLLLDEPLSNLDANLRNEMRIELKRIHSELNLTTVYVTHDQSEAMSLSDIVVVMRNGHIEQIGSPQEIYNQPKSPFVAHFMGYINRLPVTILGKEHGYWRIETANGTQLLGASTNEETSWQPGQKAVALIRPDETIADPQSDANRLTGHVQLVEYVGRAYESLVLLTGQGGTQLLAHSGRRQNSGDQIEISIDPDRLLLFSADETENIESPLMQSEPKVHVER
jgi:putative spermidine/putrescine transport system ATP-binding protein